MTGPIEYDRSFYDQPHKDIGYSLTEPTRNVVVRLPYADTGFGDIVPITMHTDGVSALVRFLDEELPDDTRRQLVVEGRFFPSPDMIALLDANPTYQFYLQTRGRRLPNTPPGKLPEELQTQQATVRRISHAVFSPATLIDTIGHQVAFYNADDLVTRRRIDPSNRFVPLWGGCNQLRLGSDTLG